MPNQIGQAYGLTVLSPLRAGFDETGKTHVEAAFGIVREIERSGESPFARIQASPDGPTVHTARWVLLDEVAKEGGHFHPDHLLSRYLLLDVNFDTDERGLAGFLEDTARSIPETIVSLYSHCVGFEGIESFPDYILRCQIETTFFFVDYASDERGKVVNVHRALGLQQAFVELTRAVQGVKPSDARKRVEGFLKTFEWKLPPGQIVKHSATPAARTTVRQRVDLKDVQGNVLRAYKHPFARHLYFRVRDAVAAKKGLLALTSKVDHSGDWGATKPRSMFNLAFSCEGLRALGVSDTTLRGFPIAFQMGMRKRAELLGDTGTSAPESWETPDLWEKGIHVLASLYADDQELLAKEVEAVTVTFGEGVDRVGHQDAARFAIDGDLSMKEHFGFSDGFGTTDIEDVGLDSTPGSGKLDSDGHWMGLAPGELLYGYLDEANEYADTPNPPDFVRNGTFLVYRKLREDVPKFRAYLTEHAKEYSDGDEELLAAKMVGRFRDGTPLASSSTPNPELVADPHRNNDFRYGDDPDGAKCPVTAHIRRARPRDALGFQGRLVDRRRLQRRGMPYGAVLPAGQPDDGEDRGILFMAFNIDIERQFEFIQQQWLNYGNSFRQGNDKDILSGNHDGTGKAVIGASDGRPPYLCSALPRFVDMRGGEYFFVPGLLALKRLAGG